MLTIILTLIILAIGSILFVASQKPDDFLYERTATINAAPSAIFPLINNLGQWDRWSPWAEMDPNAKTDFNGPDAGVGASMAWDGNAKVGKGKMTITQSVPDQKVVMHLVFIKPLSGEQDASFTLEPQGAGQTKITWSNYGRTNFMGKLMGTIMNCDKMMKKTMDQGFTNIEAAAER